MTDYANKQVQSDVLPEGWVSLRLEHMAPLETGGTPSTRVESNFGDDFPFVSPGDIGDGKYIRITARRLSKSGFDQCRAFPAGSILFVSIGSTIGKCAVASELLTANQQINAVLPSETVASDFLYYALCMRGTAIRAQAGEQAVPIVNKSQFGSTLISFPVDKHEQFRIGNALSDADALIDSLEQLLTKKRQIKQGAMQELLTGKRRLPGATGAWSVWRLREIARLIRLNVVPAQTPGAVFTHFSLPAFDAGMTPSIDLGSEIGSNKFRVPRNAVLVSKLNPRIPRVWAPNEVPENAVASTEWLVLTPEHTIDREFLYAVCRSPSFSEQMELAATGTTGSHQRISPATALDLEVQLPDDLNEQARLARVLSDFDEEITALESRLTKARTLKQAMAQALLTGRIRLVEPAAP